MSDIAIRCENLSREFDGTMAVDNLTLEIRRGDVFAFLGPNGAGKTTTLRLLIGLISPTSGSAEVLGLDPLLESQQLRSWIGVLLEDHGLYEEIRAYDNLEFFGRLQRMDRPQRVERIRDLLENHGLWEKRDDRVRTFSRGMKQRLALARAMIARPRILFLDEPTSGLDPAATRMVREMIVRLARDEDITVFLNTHNLDEVERVANRVGIIKSGRLLAFGTPEEVRRHTSRAAVVIRTEGIPEPARERIRRLPGLEDVQVSEDEVRAVLGDGANPSGLVQFLVREGVGVTEVREEKVSLEDVFLQIVEEES